MEEVLPKVACLDTKFITPDGAPLDSPALLAQFQADGTVLKVHRIVGHFEGGLRRFLRRHPQAIFVVMADLVFPHQGLPMLSIPVVVVTQNAATMQGEAG